MAKLAKKVAFDQEENEAPVTRHLQMDKVLPDKHQSRIDFEEEAINELSVSIAKIGQEQAILVNPAKGRPGFYYIFFGESRWRACKKNGAKIILCIVLKEEYDGQIDPLRILRQSAENMCRRGHKHFELVRVMSLLLQHQEKVNPKGFIGRSVGMFAEANGKSEQWANPYKTLTNLHPDLLKLIDQKGSGLTFLMGVELARNAQNEQKIVLEEAIKMNAGGSPAMLQRAISVISRRYRIASGKHVRSRPGERRDEYFKFFKKLVGAVNQMAGTLTEKEFKKFELECLGYGLGDRAPETLLQAKQVVEFLQARVSTLETFIATKK